MIYVICGLIGAGKTTYAKQQAKNDDVITDIDIDGTSKDEQLEQTMMYYQKGLNVYHVTCYPTTDEQEAFRWTDVVYVWINTTLAQARDNIINRARTRDIDNLRATLEKNDMLLNKYANSRIRFKTVELFPSDERW